MEEEKGIRGKGRQGRETERERESESEREGGREGGREIGPVFVKYIQPEYGGHDIKQC